MWTFVIELDGKRSGRQPIGGSNRRRGGSSSTPVPGESSHSGVGAPKLHLVSEPGDVLEREWVSRRLVRRLETPRHLSRRSLCHRTRTVALFRHRHHHLLRQLRD
ncbi:hypothetical protein Taro_052068 [Colocasia esculenta]|uniref:Uncharacterized protein n=1 Tax=Colocasia esculenta TaxID=4460 RepID=A0A843XIR2_COLES|nr:hypothetical protein [Colocasia esculenta]